ncbi:hypothetical protein BH24ACT3_BH24ACT3_02050 [soil metagenome]
MSAARDDAGQCANITALMDTVTVVVPTIGRVAGLRRLLEALARQDPPVPWDALVVDNAPQPRIPAIAAELDRHRLTGRVVRESRPGAARARNLAIAEATGTIVAFVDDDVVPEVGWLAALVEPITARRCEVTGGRVRLDPRIPLPPWLRPPLPALLSHYERPAPEHELEPGDYVLTANAAARTELLRRCGGFDLELGPRPGVQITNDDVALCRAVQGAGASIRYVPEAVVVHAVPPERLRRRWVVGRCWSQGRSDWLLDRADLQHRHPGSAIQFLGSTAREVVGTVQRVRRDPGTPTRLACALARGAGALAEWSRRR